MATIPLKTCELFYETRGAGDPLVLIPGFASGAWIWFRQTEALAREFCVITFDPRGVARSGIDEGRQPANTRMRAFAEDLAELLDCLKIAEANILGASFGGFVAQEFALAFPERVKKLILACTSFGGAHHVPPAPEVLQAFAATDGLNTSERIRKFMIPAFTPRFAAENDETVERVCRMREHNTVPEQVYFGQLQAAMTFDAEARAPEIENETLILTGSADQVVPPENSLNLARKIPNSSLKIIEGGSHLFFIERADEFNRIVTDFIIG